MDTRLPDEERKLRQPGCGGARQALAQKILVQKVSAQQISAAAGERLQVIDKNVTSRSPGLTKIEWFGEGLVPGPEM